ncbi:hypothetical protein [Paraburkholderia sp. MM5477-R1]
MTTSDMQSKTRSSSDQLDTRIIHRPFPVPVVDVILAGFLWETTMISTQPQPLDEALAALQGTASQFAATCIRDERVRAQYLRDIQAMSGNFQQRVRSGGLSVAEAAEQAHAMRQQILELTRMRTSPTIRAYVTNLKRTSPSLASLAEKNAQALFKRPVSALSETEQSAVWLRIVQSAGTDRTSASTLARKLGTVGRRLLLVSVAVGVYEVYKAENKPREIARQGTIAAAGAWGGWAVSTGAVATGVCTATAPVCVGAVALIGGILFAFGSDIVFGTVYQTTMRR